MQLPPELWHRVIESIFHRENREGRFLALYSDDEVAAKNTLLACSRVSYAFRKAALPSLFHVLAINVRCEHASRDDAPPPRCSCRRLSELDALRDIVPVRDNVREVRLCAFCPACRKQSSRTSYRRIDGNLLLSAVSLFTQIRRAISFSGLRLSYGHPLQVTRLSLLLVIVITDANTHHLAYILQLLPLLILLFTNVFSLGLSCHATLLPPINSISGIFALQSRNLQPFARLRLLRVSRLAQVRVSLPDTLATQ